MQLKIAKLPNALSYPILGKNGKSSKKAKYLICQACVKSFRLKGNDRSKFCSRNIRIVQKVHMHGVYYLWFFQKITHLLPCLLHYIILRNINSNSSDIRIRSSFRVITEYAESTIFVHLGQINNFSLYTYILFFKR
jgi:hypothetical protein